MNTFSSTHISRPPLTGGHPRHSHRKKVSALRLSSDTTATLPEYIPSGGWQSREPLQTPDDLPPDYPDSAEEADEDTDSEPTLYTQSTSTYTALPAHHSHHHSTLTSPASPRRRSRPNSYGTSSSGHSSRPSISKHTYSNSKSNITSTDSYLDSLLERSVQALEMSNVLLLKSSSQPPSATIGRTSSSDADEPRYRSSSNVHKRKISSVSAGTSGSRSTGRSQWADDLDELKRGVDMLFTDDGAEQPTNQWRTNHQRERTDSSMSISSSLPSSSTLKRHRRRPSLDLDSNADSADVPHLRFEAQARTNLVSPAPRALTQYIDASTIGENNTIVLPSTIGLRSSSSTYTPPITQTPILSSPSPRTSPNLHATLAEPKITDTVFEPATRAYNILSSFVYRPQAHKSASSLVPSTPPILTSPSLSSLLGTTNRRGSSNPSTSSERGGRPRASPSRRNSESSFRIGGLEIEFRRSRSQTPKPVMATQPRVMTPPIEESSNSQSDSDSSGCPAKQTVSALRKILDEQPVVVPKVKVLPAPNLLSPAPLAEATTSTATASISKLFTKGVHSSSARPSSPPKRTSLKLPTSPNGSGPSSASSSTGANTPKGPPSPLRPTHVSRNSLQIIPDLLTSGLASLPLVGGSGSGKSTPKRISFAELPESYAQTRPEGSSSKFQQKKNKKKHKRQGSGGRSETSSSRLSNSRRDEGSIEIGGWLGWLVGGTLAGPSGSLRPEERTEDRMNRSWGRGGVAGVEDWTM